MSAPEGRPVACEMVHPTLYVSDLSASIEFYTSKLGFTLGFTWGEPPAMAGVNFDRVSMFLEMGRGGGAAGAVYFVVDGVDELYAIHRRNGVTAAPPANQEYGMREYQVRDPDGHTIAFGEHAIAAGPPLEIQRVDVPVRMEKRLAAVLEELARHKRMTVGECLEETLLHSFEPVREGGAATPHTSGDLAHIAALKEKHGIDYDAHGSYRFVEK